MTNQTEGGSGNLKIGDFTSPASTDSILDFKARIKDITEGVNPIINDGTLLAKKIRRRITLDDSELSPFIDIDADFIFESSGNLKPTNYFTVMSFSGNIGDGAQDFYKIVVRAVETDNSTDDINGNVLVYGYGPKEGQDEEDTETFADSLNKWTEEVHQSKTRLIYTRMIGQDIYDFLKGVIQNLHPSIDEDIKKFKLAIIDNPLVLSRISETMERKFMGIASVSFMDSLYSFLSKLEQQ